jgi:hypothetical protein
MKKTFTVIAILLGLGCLVATYMYWTIPANMLPSFFPGYDPSLAAVHFKHGLAALIVALAFFVYAWFNSGKKKSA